MTNALVLGRTRTLSEILSASWSLYGRNQLFQKLLILSLPGVIAGLSIIAINSTLPDWSAGFPVFVLGFLESAILGSAAIYALGQYEQGGVISIRDSLFKAWDRLPDLVVATVISFAIIGLLCVTVIGIPFAMMRLVRWAFTSQAVMLDEQDGEKALGYSADLVAGRGWPTAGSLVAIYAIQFLPGVILVELIGLAIDRSVLAIVNVGVTALMFPFGTTARTLLYYDLKMRKALA